MSREAMKIFRTAFWLGIIIYNLPSPTSQPPAPEPQINGSRGLAAKAASQLCSMSRESCLKNGEAIPNSGERGVHSSPPSHDTLTPTDRAVLWRGPGRQSAGRETELTSAIAVTKSAFRKARQTI